MAEQEGPQDRPQDTPAPVQPTGDELALRRRVSDLERENVAELLRESAGEGRLSYAELEDRLEGVYGAKTYGELVQLTTDLPNGLVPPQAQSATPQYAAQPSYTPQHNGETVPVINVFLSDSKRTGAWIAPQRQEVNAVLGDVTLDFTEAQMAHDVMYIDVKSILADVKIRVPQNAIVHLDSNPILGSVSEQEAGFGGVVEPSTAPPKTFHIRGTAILGEIKIKRGPRLSKRLRLH
ncbi:DUF1707 SHOCT-like domain-containing protein [Kribbella lupini]|uniref:Cell wall-active antibiotic response 4TMS protein YvqF n=1 Tax=Kribbella lupini TaxID=291602 RepID=A0ABP4MRD8_9ACTN